MVIITEEEKNIITSVTGKGRKCIPIIWAEACEHACTSDGTQDKYFVDGYWYKLYRYGGEGAAEELANMNADYLDQSLARYQNMNLEHKLFHNIALGMPDRITAEACDALLVQTDSMNLRGQKDHAIFLTGIAYSYAGSGGLAMEDNRAASRSLIIAIETCGTPEEIGPCFYAGIRDYADRVRRCNGYENLSGQVQQAVRYVIAHINEPMLLKDVCRTIGLSPEYLSRELKAQTGYSFPQMVSHAKILKARTLLETTDRSVTEIAYQLSFSSSNQFATSFKKACGMSPTEYRKNYSK